MDAFNAVKEYGAAWLQLIKDHFKLFLLEAELTKQSILPAIICGVVCLILSAIMWMSILSLIGYIVYAISLKIWVALFAIFLINGMVLLITFLYLRSFYRNIGFKKTIKHWRSYQQLKLDLKK